MSGHPEPELVLHGGQPVRQQIEEQLRACIALGLLSPGEPLPTVRAVAVGLEVSPHLVDQAYGRLQREGLLSSEEGSGTFVACPPRTGPAAATRGAELRRRCARFLLDAARGGFSFEEVLDALRAFGPGSSPS